MIEVLWSSNKVPWYETKPDLLDIEKIPTFGHPLIMAKIFKRRQLPELFEKKNNDRSPLIFE